MAMTNSYLSQGFAVEKGSSQSRYQPQYLDASSWSIRRK